MPGPVLGQEEAGEEYIHVGEREQHHERMHYVAEFHADASANLGCPRAAIPAAHQPIGDDRTDRATDEHADTHTGHAGEYNHTDDSADRATPPLAMKAKDKRVCSSRPCAMPIAAEPTITKPKEPMPVPRRALGW